jgi:hypothetical protein
MMSRVDHGFIHGRWYVGYKGLAVALCPLKEWEWGYKTDWYDGPLYLLGFGPVVFSYVP